MMCSVVKIGTSKGIRIPSKILKELENPEKFELSFENQKIILIPQKIESRVGWSDAFEKMADMGDDRLIIDDSIDLDLI